VDGYGSIALGIGDSSIGNYATTIGLSNKATTWAFACGSENYAGGIVSFSAGRGGLAYGGYTSTLGYGSLSRSMGEVSVGLFNTDYSQGGTNSFVSTDRIFQGGIGTDANNRANALTILKNGRTGVGNDAPVSKLHLTGGGGYNDGFTLENTNGSSYGAINFLTPGGLIGQFLSSGPSFSSGIFQSNFVTLANYINSGGITLLAAGTSGVIKFATAGYDLADEKMKIDAVGRVGIGTQAGGIAASALLDLTSTTRGLLLPRMTKAQRDAISSPVAGLSVYQTDNTPGLRVYNGTNWMRFTETTD
jgi:hypothetical protein